jgi:hypothetical protein
MKKEFVILTFFVLCVPIRSFLVYMAYINRLVSTLTVGTDVKVGADGKVGAVTPTAAAALADKVARIQLLAVFTFGVAIYWFFIYFSGLLSGIWWNPYRLIHAVNFLIFSALVYLKYEYAFIILLLDLIFGVTVFILQNYDFISKYVRENITDTIKRYSIKFS